jgi:Secretion system C-terminal sorting domain
MKILVSILAFIAFTSQLWGQCGVQYVYDNAGNRIKRTVVFCLVSEDDESNSSFLKTLKPSQPNLTKTMKVEFQAYPNPSNGHFDVVVDAVVENTSIVVYDITGKQVHTQNVISERTSIDVSKIAKGIFVVVYRDATRSLSTLKMVIE